jgi:hypothetical protein
MFIAPADGGTLSPGPYPNPTCPAALPGDMSQDVTAEALQDIKNKQLSLFQLILEQLVQV